MSKKGKTQPAQTAQEIPETEWPQTGGTYIRDPETGALTRLEDSDESVPGNDQHNQNEDLNHVT